MCTDIQHFDDYVSQWKNVSQVKVERVRQLTILQFLYFNPTTTFSKQQEEFVTV